MANNEVKALSNEHILAYTHLFAVDLKSKYVDVKDVDSLIKILRIAIISFSRDFTFHEGSSRSSSVFI